MKLSEYFTLSEFTQSDIAEARKIKNDPPAKAVSAIKALVEQTLQPARQLLGLPIHITSGFRSAELNEVIGGAKGSQHTKGEAADIISSDSARVFHFIAEHCNYDQLIWEFGDDQQPDWVHVSYKAGANRKERLRAKRVNGVTKYKPF